MLQDKKTGRENLPVLSFQLPDLCVFYLYDWCSNGMQHNLQDLVRIVAQAISGIGLLLR